MSLQDRLKGPPAEDILYEHLGYAVDLTAMALREIAEPGHSDELREWYRQMSIVEVFWSQARLLIEFFAGSLASENTTAASHFTTKPLTYDFAFGDKDIRTVMNNQIAHMNRDRTIVLGEKFQPEDMWRVGGAIQRALDQFVENLREEFHEAWNLRTGSRLRIEAGNVYASPVLGASSAAPQALGPSLTTSVAPKLVLIGPSGSTGSEGPAQRTFGPTGPSGRR